MNFKGKNLSKRLKVFGYIMAALALPVAALAQDINPPESIHVREKTI